MTPNFKNKALVTLKPDDDFVALQIYDGMIRRRLSTFLINREKLAAVAEGTEGSMLDSDLDNTLRVYRQKAELKFVVFYVRNESNDGRFEGIAERFTLPITDVLNVLVCNSTVTRVIYKNQSLQQARIEFGFNAHRAIKEIIQDPVEKRALIKAFRDSFRYGKNEEIFITDDYNGFFFQVIGSFCGGLIRHEREVMGRDGNYYRHVCYEIHT